MLRRAHCLIPATVAGFVLTVFGHTAGAQDVEKSGEPAPAGGLETQSEAPDPSQTAVEEALFECIRKLLADPEGRKSLEPAGAETLLLRDYPKSEAGGIFQSLEAPAAMAAAARLEALDDPLAARLAATIVRRRAHAKADSALSRLAAKFPDDPALSLAASSIGMSHDPNVHLAAYVHAWGNLKTIAQDHAGNLSVCGVGIGLQYHGPKTVDAVTGFLLRVRPARIPDVWRRWLEGAAQPDGQGRTGQMESILEILIHHHPSSEGEPAFPFQPLLKKLVDAGRGEHAARLAMALVLRARGALTQGEGEYRHILPAWQDSSSLGGVSGKSEAWRWIQLAAGEKPAILVEALDKTRADHPSDAHLALSSLLARSLMRPLSASDLAVLDGLDAPSRDLALTYAGMILPPRLLPPSLCLEAWERQAASWIHSDWHGQALACLERLAGGLAPEAADRIRRQLTDSLSERPFNAWLFPELAARMEAQGSPESQKAWLQLLNHWSGELPESPALTAQLTSMLRHLHRGGNREWPRPAAELPPSLAERVTSVLETAAARPPAASPQLMDHYDSGQILGLAIEAVEHPRWHPVLTRLADRHPVKVSSSPALRDWDVLARLLAGMEDASLAPVLRVTLNHRPDSPPKVDWTLRGLVRVEANAGSSAESGQDQDQVERNQPEAPVLPPLPAAAGPAVEKYRAEFFIKDPNGVETVLARVDPLSMEGSISLPEEKLPATGVLSVRVISRAGPGYSPPVVSRTFSTAPVLLDTMAGGQWSLPSPNNHRSSSYQFHSSHWYLQSQRRIITSHLTNRRYLLLIRLTTRLSKNHSHQTSNTM
ncbi:MAG: hypothetical protein EOP86_12380 [Verrucomicrobiaceae bacterium]|nr:MAG: hypothetical protein EOP86_12380 [Verrucomicrobiaceae bacterium]